jgi:hypothetical protein
VRRALLVCALALACRNATAPARAPRTFRMGFSAIPPRPDQAVTLQSLNLWTSGHADAAIMHISVPYVALLSGLTAPQEVRGNELGLANYYRAKGLRLIITVDVTNGLDRAREDPVLDRIPTTSDSRPKRISSGSRLRIRSIRAW